MTTWDLLEGLDEADRQLVLSAATRRRYGRREVLFSEGDPGESLYLLETGRVAVRITTPAGDTATLTVLGPGQCFGEMALMKRSAERTATVIALEPVSVLTLQRGAFAALRRRHPEVERVLVSILAARVDRLSGQLVEALYVPTEIRVARRLVDLVRVYHDGVLPVVIPLTQEDVAGMAGTTRPTTNTVLRGLQDDGLLRLARGRIEVLDAPGLARRAR